MLFSLSPYLPASWENISNIKVIPISQFRFPTWKRSVFMKKMEEALTSINKNPEAYTEIKVPEKGITKTRMVIAVYILAGERWEALEHLPHRVDTSPENALETTKSDLATLSKIIGRLELRLQSFRQYCDQREEPLYHFLEKEGYTEILYINKQFYGKHPEFGHKELHLIQREELEYLQNLMFGKQT